MGIEPTYPAWKAGALTDVLHPHMAPPVGLEPTTLRLTAACSTDWAMEEYLNYHVTNILYHRQGVMSIWKNYLFYF